MDRDGSTPMERHMLAMWMQCSLGAPEVVYQACYGPCTILGSVRLTSPLNSGCNRSSGGITINMNSLGQSLVCQSRSEQPITFSEKRSEADICKKELWMM